MASKQDVMKGNRGEWGEAYAFCQLLGSGIVTPTDDKLNVVDNQRLIVKSVARRESDDREFVYSIDKGASSVEISLNGAWQRTVPQDQFAECATAIFTGIKTKSGRSFAILEVEDFLHSIGCYKLKPSDTDKPDITLTVFDPKTESSYSMQYSVKCMAGARPSLVNSSGLTYVHYELLGFDMSDFNDIEKIPQSRVKERVAACKERSRRIVYRHLSPEAGTFKSNLQRVHPYAEETLAYMILESYSVRGKQSQKVLDKVKDDNPLEFSDTDLYEIAFRHYLWAAFCGMVPSVEWRFHDTVDGFLLINEIGQILSYPIVKRGAFEKHLVNATSFDTPSTKGNRATSQTGAVYEYDGRYFLELNLLIKYDANAAKNAREWSFTAVDIIHDEQPDEAESIVFGYW